MAFANVNQQSKSFPRRNEKHVDLNMFDLSHDVKTTFTMGKLVPILTLEVLPSDHWYIRMEAMLRFAPLYLPIMHRVNLSVDYFYVPNRIMWPLTQNVIPGSEEASGWEIFINPSQSPNLTFSSIPPHPYVELLPYAPDPPNVVTGRSGELAMYMGYPTVPDGAPGGQDLAFNVNAFPFAAYYMVWDYIYRNDQIQDRIFTQLVQGDNSTRMPILYTGSNITGYLLCAYRNWNRDNWTSATPTPQVGSDVLMPMVNSDFTTVGGLSYPGPYRWREQVDDSIPTTGNIQLQGGANDGATFSAAGERIYIDIQETAPSIAQLRYSLMLQEFLERALRAGDRYNDFISSFFGVDPFAGIIQQPEFLGSKRGKVVISEVMSTAETATLKVGNYAGQALALESTNDTIEFKAKEHGILLGIISVFPDSSYMQGIERIWSKSIPQDYAFEQFALIGDQAILNKEVNVDFRTLSPNPDYNDEVFAYNRRYYEYMYKNDLYSGLMRTTFISFHLGRLLSVTDPHLTVLDSTFIECRPDVTRVFQVAEDEDEIYAHIYNDVKVRRRLPKNGIPAV